MNTAIDKAKKGKQATCLGDLLTAQYFTIVGESQRPYTARRNQWGEQWIYEQDGDTIGRFWNAPHNSVKITRSTFGITFTAVIKLSRFKCYGTKKPNE